MTSYDLIIIGAGPSGLACAIEAKKKGLSLLMLDKGSVVDAIRRFPVEMTFFSTSELLEIGGVPFTSAGFRPSRVECVRYYQMVARYFDLPVKQGVEVIGIRRHDAGFEIISRSESFLTKNVVDATGYFDHPNRFDVPGSPEGMSRLSAGRIHQSKQRSIFFATAPASPSFIAAQA
jgi:thioredoxin reductase (NADPH)